MGALKNTQKLLKSSSVLSALLFSIATLVLFLTIGMMTLEIFGFQSIVDTFTIYYVDSINPSFYSGSLTLIAGIVGILVPASIFLIENTNQRYSRTLSRTYLEDKYLLFSYIAIFSITAYNFTALALNLKGIFFGAAFSLTLISLAYALVVLLRTLHFLKGTTMIEKRSKKIQEKITPRNIYRFRLVHLSEYSEESIEEIKKDVLPIINAGITSIESSDFQVFESSLEEIENITFVFLNSTPAELTENFLNYLNTEFKYVIDACFSERRNQRFLSDVVDTVGNIAKEIYEKRSTNINQAPGMHWISTLQEIYYRSLNLKRTSACINCIDKLEEIVLLALEDRNFQSYSIYRRTLFETVTDNQSSSEPWTVRLTNRAVLSFQKQSKLIFRMALNDDITNQEGFARQFYDQFANLMLEPLSDLSKMGQRSILDSFIGFGEGEETITAFISKLDISESDKKEKYTFSVYLEEFIKFYQKIVLNSWESGSSQLYNFYPELLYIIETKDFSEEISENLEQELHKNFISVVRKTYSKENQESTNITLSTVDQTIQDYYAIMIYMNKENSELVEKRVKDLIEVFKEFTDDEDSREFTNLYKLVKLLGAWNSGIDELDDVEETIIDEISDYYQDYGRIGKAIPRGPLQEYGYPYHSVGGGLWMLTPSHVWTNSFQDKVSGVLNGENYEKFHEKLSESSN